MPEEKVIRCQVRPGLFGDEFIVAFDVETEAERQRVEFVADRTGVQLLSQPTRDRPGEGLFRVWSLGKADGDFIVLIPASGGSESRKVRVPEELVA